MNFKQKQRKNRHKRVRAKIKGTSARPRLSVFRSNQYIYAQIADDESRSILVNLRGEKTIKGAGELGKDIAKEAKAKNIDKVVFDRGGYKYHGRVKELAEEARKGGLQL